MTFDKFLLSTLPQFLNYERQIILLPLLLLRAVKKIDDLIIIRGGMYMHKVLLLC